MRCDSETIVEGILTAWFLQDIPATLAYCADDMCYAIHGPPDAAFAGTHRGKDELTAFLRSISEAWEFLAVVPTGLVVTGNFAREITQFRSRYRPTGQVLESTKRHIWCIEGGLVRRCDEYQDTPIMRAFLHLGGGRRGIHR